MAMKTFSSKTFASSAVFAAFALGALALGGLGSTQASAMPIAHLDPAAAHASFAPTQVGFVFGEEFLPGRSLGLSRIDTEAAQAAAEAYYDFDALIGFGAFALAGAALAAIGAAFARRDEDRRNDVIPAEGANWRERTLRSVEKDLARFAGGLRRAA